MSFRSLLNTLIGRRSSPVNLQLAFYKEAAIHGMHGSINVSHRGFNLNGKPVRFVFVGVHTPPAVTPELLTYIFEEAKVQGFIPHHIELYGLLNDRIVTRETMEKLRAEGRLGTLEQQIEQAEGIQQPDALTQEALDAMRRPVATEASLMQRRAEASTATPSIERSATN